MARIGLDYATLSRLNKRLIYLSHKGFLPGPYENRTALDEVVQMMGGLAQMRMADGKTVPAPLLPLMMDRERLPVRAAPPAIGADTDEVLRELGYADAEVKELREAKVVG